MEFIKFEELVGISKVEELDRLLCEKNVCGGKVMCFFSKDGKYVVKEMRKSFNEGKDCMVLDELKEIFGFKKMGMRRIKCDKVVERIDKKIKFWKGNMVIKEKKSVYLIMNKFENIGSLSKKKERDENKKVMMEYMKIIFFRGIFRVSDGNYRNVLINSKNELMSIDENNIGKRIRVLERRFRIKNYSEEDIKEVINNLKNNNIKKKEEIRKVMKKYNFSDEDIEKVINNFDNLEVDINNDIKFFWKDEKVEKVEKVEKDERSIRVFGSISMNGYKCDLLKSCIIKYMRRGEFEKGVYFLMELDLFKNFIEVKNNKEINGESLRSNMRNRILIMMSEDIGYGDWKLWMKCNYFMKKWEDNRLNNNNIDRLYLINLYKLFCDSKKSRNCSFIRGFWKIGYIIDGVRKKYKSYYIGIEDNIKGYGKEYYKKNDSDELKLLIDGFVEMLKLGDDRVFYWFFKIFDYNGKIGSRGRRRKSIYVIWDILERNIIKEDIKNLIELKDVVFNWVVNNNNSRNENWMWIVCLIKFYIGRNSYNWEEVVNYDLEINNIDEIVNKNINFEKIIVDDYCFDMHVFGGEKGKKGNEKFWKEGSIVFNEDENIVDELYKKVYGDIKMKNY